MAARANEIHAEVVAFKFGANIKTIRGNPSIIAHLYDGIVPLSKQPA
jgi:hypothetical protein